jgi:hypothetical protein
LHATSAHPFLIRFAYRTHVRSVRGGCDNDAKQLAHPQLTCHA